MTFTLLNPLQGWIGSLDEVPDPVFAERMLGDGVAIDPTGSVLHSPCDAEVLSVASTRHSVTLRAPNGAEILIHIGLETVALNGEGFTAHVQAGQRVRAGDRLISFDIDLLARRAKSLLTPMLVTNSEAFTIRMRPLNREAKVGEALIDLHALPGFVSSETAGDAEVRRSVKLALPHGLHARPAGRVAALLKPFAAEVSVLHDGRTANARSPVSLMALGAAHGDTLVLVGSGADADVALNALAAFLASDGGEAPSRAPALATEIKARPIDDGVLRGVSAAPGHAIGRAVQYRRTEIRVEEAGADAHYEQRALDAAINAVRIRSDKAGDEGDAGADIMQAHSALLDDPEIHAAAHAFVAQGKSAGWAWARSVDTQAERLGALSDPRLRERAADLLDLKRQVLVALGGEVPGPPDLPPDAILLADDLLPSELMALKGRISALCTAHGGPTSHVAIIAAALGIPAMVAAGQGVFAVPEGAVVILDAAAGTLVVDPAPDVLAAARAGAALRHRARAAALAEAGSVCLMADGTRIEIFANLASVAEAAPAIAFGAEGCGLLRSEFLFMDRAAPPDEAEQRAAYQAIADQLAGRPLIIRTLDIGGDKAVAYLPLPKEDNPALGLRGVRTSLWRPDLLRTQIRAIFGVTPPGACRIMVPMVTSVAELTAVRMMLEEERRALGVADPIELGVMIETPAAAVTAAAIAVESDFLSIGTNDLTQYALAMDRTNPAVAAEVDALHPAVLRLIALACEGARANGRIVGVCGGLASEIAAAPILIGLGVTELSAIPAAIPDLKAAIRPLRMERCQAIAQDALKQTSAGGVRTLLAERQHNALEVTS